MLIKRNIQQIITPWLSRDEIIMLNGPRQTGKTSLLRLLQQDLEDQGVSKERIFYLNLEKIDVLTNLNGNPENLLKYIKNTDQKAYFLIDEIQYLDNPSNFLKHLYDEYRDKVKLIITGSSSLELKAKLQDSLAGRKIVFNIGALSFEEFLRFQQSELLDYFYHQDIPLEIKNKFKQQLDQYMLFGGLPAVVLAPQPQQKEILLKNYVSDYINKDIRYIGKIDNIAGFNQLARVLAGQINGLLNINELSNTLNLRRAEIDFYLTLLEQTFVLYRVNPYRKNIRSQITKMPKICFFDTGIRNQILNDFTPMENRTDAGSLFENFVFLELCQKIDKENIFFYRTTHKAEIDFVFDKDGITYPIEVKYKTFSKPVSARSLLFFSNLQQIKCPSAYLINLNLNQQKDKIRFLTFINLAGRIIKD